MANYVQFDIEKLNKFSQQLTSLAEGLNDTSNKLTEDLEKLKNDWKTPAGKKFFMNQTCEWKEQVQKYIELVYVLKDMVDYAVDEYTEVDKEARLLIKK